MNYLSSESLNDLSASNVTCAFTIALSKSCFSKTTLFSSPHSLIVSTISDADRKLVDIMDNVFKTCSSILQSIRVKK